MPFFQSALVGLMVMVAILGLFWLLFRVAHLICSRSRQCSGCQRAIDLKDKSDDYGLVFECAECGARNIIRPKASLPGWTILTGLFAFDCWASFKLLEFRMVYKARYLNWAFGQVKPENSAPWLFSWWVLLILALMFCATFHGVFFGEDDPGPDKRVKL